MRRVDDRVYISPPAERSEQSAPHVL
jgi:hypothetical protein